MAPFCIFTDAGGTLIRPSPSVGAVYGRAGRPFGLTAAPEDLERAFVEHWTNEEGTSLARRRSEGLSAWRPLVMRVFDTVGFWGPREPCFTACYDAFEKADAWSINKPLLRALRDAKRRGVQVGLLSNFDYRLRAILSALDITNLFDWFVISSEQGSIKQTGALFDAAESVTRLAPPSLLHIGDSERLDLRPADERGWTVRLIEHWARNAPHTCEGLINDVYWK